MSRDVVLFIAPQLIYPSQAPSGYLALIGVAGVAGLMWAWVAGNTGTILWVTLAHVLFDFSGLGGRIYFDSNL